MPVCESKPRVYWIACAAVAGGWFTTVIQGIFVYSTFDFTTPEHRAIITKHDWEKRFV